MSIFRLTLALVIPVCLAILSLGCSSSTPTDPGIPAEGTRIMVANSLGETLSQFIYTNSAYLTQNDIMPTGSAPNFILINDDKGYVLNSTSNSVLVFDTLTMSLIFEASVGVGKSPYNMAFINDDELIITNFVANDCVRMNINETYTGDRIKATIPMPTGNDLPKDSGVVTTSATPEAVVVVDSKAYVTLANLNMTTFAAGGPGLIGIINLTNNQFMGTVQTTGRNTVGLCRNPVFPNELFVLSAGDIDTDTYHWLDNGKIDVFTTNSPGITHSVDVDGAPFEMVVASNGYGYVADASAGKILTLDTINLTFGSTIQVVEGSGLSYISGLAVGPNNLLYAIEFNNDQLVIIDTASDNEIVQRIPTGDGPDAITVIW